MQNTKLSPLESYNQLYWWIIIYSNGSCGIVHSGGRDGSNGDSAGGSSHKVCLICMHIVVANNVDDGGDCHGCRAVFVIL